MWQYLVPHDTVFTAHYKFVIVIAWPPELIGKYINKDVK